MQHTNDFAPLLTFGSGQLAALCIVVAGFLFMFGLKKFASRVLLMALLFVVVGVLGPGWIPN